MRYKISIVIPIYNSDKFLNECIESIIHQTIGFENIQLILVNDGSKDKCGQIIDTYCQQYDNIIGIHLKKSHTLAGYARNKGVEQAKGQYLMFVDSDDYIAPNACQIMYDTITSNHADIVTANYKCMDGDGKVWENPMFNQEKYPSCELKEADEKFAYLYCAAVWMKIFNNDLIQQHHIQFLDGVPAEDAYFSYKALIHSKKVCYLQDVIYYYRRRNTGKVSTSWMRNKRYFIDINFAFQEIYKLFQEAEKMEYYKCCYSKNLVSLTYKFIDSKLITDKDRVELLGILHWFFEQSRTLNITIAQTSIKILIDYIIEKKYDDVVKICAIIAELRSFMSEVEKETTSKPQKIVL